MTVNWWKGDWSKGYGHVKKDGSVCFETITFYYRGWGDMPRDIGFEVHNDSDSMTDYFEKDRIYFAPSHKNYNEVLQAWCKMEKKNLTRWIAKLEKKITEGRSRYWDKQYLEEYKARLAKIAA